MKLDIADKKHDRKCERYPTSKALSNQDLKIEVLEKRIILKTNSALYTVSMALLLAGCNTTSVTSTGFSKSNAGIPYHLPKSVQKIDIEVLREDDEIQEIVFTATPMLVPDRTRLFYLNSVNHSTFNTNHKFTIKNGMLSNVDTVDDGQIGEVLLSLVNTASSLKKLGTTGAQSSGDNPFLTTSPVITGAEIAAAIDLISGHEFSFIYDGPTGSYSLPGTTGLLEVNSSLSMPQLSTGSKGLVDPDKLFSGVYAKSLTSASVNTELKIMSAIVKSRRIDAYNAAISETNGRVSTQGSREAAAQASIDKVCRGIPRQLWTGIDAISRAIHNLAANTAQDKRDQYTNCKQGIENFARTRQSGVDDVAMRVKLTTNLGVVANLSLSDRTISSESSIVLVPDPERDVRIPLSKALLGSTTNKVDFSDGVVTSYHSTKPALAVEVAKTVENVFKGIVGIPAEIVQFKIDNTGKNKDLVAKQIELDAELRKLELANDLNNDDEAQATESRVREVERLINLQKKELELLKIEIELDQSNRARESAEESAVEPENDDGFPAPNNS